MVILHNYLHLQDMFAALSKDYSSTITQLLITDMEVHAELTKAGPIISLILDLRSSLQFRYIFQPRMQKNFVRYTKPHSGIIVSGNKCS